MKHFVVDAIKKESDGTISDWLQVAVVVEDRPTAVQIAINRIRSSGYDTAQYTFEAQRLTELERGAK